VQVPRRMQRPDTQRASADDPHWASPVQVLGSQQPPAPQTSSVPQLPAVQAATHAQPHRIWPASSQAGMAPHTG